MKIDKLRFVIMKDMEIVIDKVLNFKFELLIRFIGI